MIVTVRLFATLTKYRPAVTSGEPFSVKVAAGSTLSDLLETLAIPRGAVHLVMIDGRIRHDRQVPLTKGCRIGLFPPVGGG